MHLFGAYFGLAASFMHRGRNVAKSEKLEGSLYSSDLFAMVGTVLLWVFWPSFNGILAHEDAFDRVVVNTYLSLVGSTLAVFVVATFFGE